MKDFNRMKREYDDNSVFLVGKLGDIEDKYFWVKTEKDNFPVAITDEFKDIVGKLKEKMPPSGVTVFLWGAITNNSEDKKDYIYPMSVSFSSVPQRERKTFYATGQVMNIYEFDNRYRILLESKKKLSTRFFVTVYKSKGLILDNSLIGKKILVSGYVYNSNNRLDVVAEGVFVPLQGDASSVAANEPEVVGFDV